ncbi:MAG: tagaturonate epimerase family protein [Kiritimatiellia bacterium]|jgi:hypothetical protein|nr:tagaturonate epimerase family protein [Kiritimatiellia bacterium]
MIMSKYSIGTGDRFGKQGVAQLNAVIQAKAEGIDLEIVWNKSHREHTTIQTTQDSVRREADEAVSALDWQGGYYVDADHIGLATVDNFIASSDFFTLDVADFTGKRATEESIDAFVARHSDLIGSVEVPGMAEPVAVTGEKIRHVAEEFLLAVQEAGKIYRHIEGAKGTGTFVTEVSMDETDEPQTPEDMMLILAAIADEGIPSQTIAPKFSGRFNKGVDYVGDAEQFEREFEDDVCVISWAVREFGLPANLKLSVHSGSDKFSIYGGINRVLRKHDAGLHVKTAGTTWLEELIGLAESGGNAAGLVKNIYARSLDRYGELCAPYATVIDIDTAKLPPQGEFFLLSGADVASAIRHDQSNPAYNPNIRQLLHVGYKVAAEMGERYLDALDEYSDRVAANVTGNIYERHILPLFGMRA